MSTFATNILGLDIGARQIGVSILRNEELVFYAVKSIKRNSKTKVLKQLEKVLTALIEKYDIEVFTLKKIVYRQQQNSFVKTVYEETKDFALNQNIRLFEYNPKLIRQIICGLEKPTKRNTALLLTQRYAELARYFNVPKLWQKRYLAQLFDAIAVGLVCARELKETKQLSATNSR
ncbi:MAG: crossover junction endodeoxyribonuclease RuvC [Acidobacteriota bacterium]|nr:crossover junction endodeoxyribonuclease RuvC [Acidobacteriota bacterium]